MAFSTMTLALTLLCSTLLFSALAASAATHSEPLLFVPPPHPSTHFESNAPVPAPVHAPGQAPAHHHQHHQSNHSSTHRPAQAPALAPTHHHHNHHPSQAPAPAPVHTPTSLPPRKFVAVQGVVFCKSCQYRGVQTLLGATPLSGAVVKLQCNNTRIPQVKQATTDKNGYFFIQAPKTVTSYGAHKCKASLVSSPEKKCDQATDLYSGFTGSNLWLDRRSVADNLPFVLFSAGPFAFEPSKAVNCSH